MKCSKCGEINPVVSDDFQIGPNGAFEMSQEVIELYDYISFLEEISASTKDKKTQSLIVKFLKEKDKW